MRRRRGYLLFLGVVAAFALWLLPAPSWLVLPWSPPADPDEAREAQEAFMAARLAGDEERVMSYFTPAGRATFTGQDMQVYLGRWGRAEGYVLRHEQRDQRSVQVVASYYVTDDTRPRAAYWNEQFTWARTARSYRISAAEVLGYLLTAVEGDRLVLERPGHRQDAFRLGDLPETFVPRDDDTETPQPARRDAFLRLAFAPDSTLVAVTTLGPNGLLAVFDLNEGTVTARDLWVDGEGIALSWAPSGEYLAAVVDADDEQRLDIYATDSWERLAGAWQEHLPVPGGAIAFAGWDEDDRLHIQIQEPETTTQWTIDPATGETTT